MIGVLKKLFHKHNYQMKSMFVNVNRGVTVVIPYKQCECGKVVKH